MTLALLSIIFILLIFIYFQYKKIDSIKYSNKKLISTLSHELKTPLTVLRSHLENEIYDENLPIEFRQKLVNDVEEISRLTKLINSFLQLMKFELNNIKPNLTEINLTEILMDIIDILTLIAKEKNIKLSFICEEHFNLVADKQMLYQALFNIIENSIKYSNSKVVVRVKRDKNRVKILVQDDGNGIKESEIEKVFSIFYQIDKKKSGTGIGLAIANAIIKAHKGVIKVVSKLNSGTTFEINLKINSSL